MRLMRGSSKAKLIGVFLLVAAALKVAMALRARVGVDEWQHLHAAWCISVGQVPYLDFFEHHPPFLYYLLQPIFALVEPGFSLVLAARGLMLAINVGIAAATWALARACFGARTATWAVVLLASEVTFFDYGESETAAFVGIECHGGFSRTGGFPSVWIVEAKRGAAATGSAEEIAATFTENFIKYVESGH